MSDRQSFLLSPYRPPTSYPVTLDGDEAAAWLTGYASLWHPLALHGRSRPPQPASAYDHDQPQEGALYAVPQGPTLTLADDWDERVTAVGAVAVKATADRVATLGDLIGRLPGPPIAADLVRLFAGVGFGYLMLDTLFDAMNHDRLLDGEAFWVDVTAAVDAAKAGDGTTARAKLAAAAAKMLAAREALTGNAIQLLDWVMPGGGTVWPPSPHPFAVIATAEELEQMAKEQPERFAELKANVPATVDLCIGAMCDRDDALLPSESQLWSLRSARETVTRLFDHAPTIYARRRSSFHAHLPAWLSAAGFTQAIVASFDGAMVPARYSSVIHWPAPDGKTVLGFSRDPLPGDDPQTFFNLAYHIHQAISHDSVPTVVLLHKSGTIAPGYDDWLALSELAPVLGEWVGLNRYLTDAHSADYVAAATPDDYFADTLDDRVTTRHRPDPVSGFARHDRLRRKLDGTFALAALHRSLTNPTPADEAAVSRLIHLEKEVEHRGPDIGPADAHDEIAKKLDAEETAWANRLAERLLARSEPNRPGFLMLNPSGFTRRIALELHDVPGWIPIDGPVKASEFADGIARVVVEVPGLGFAWLPRGTASTPVPKPRLKTAEGVIVRNEFFEAEIDPGTGGLRSFRDARLRMNRFGQLLVYQPGSTMKATSVTVTHAGAALGEITSHGQIVDPQGVPLAAFRQRVRAWMGRPALELHIEITPIAPPTGYPWHAFYGCRFAWRDDRAALFRGSGGTAFPTTHPRPVSPDFVEVRLGGERSFLFLGGLPFVQKHEKRMLDVVLIPEGETATTFDLLIAADRDHPMPTAAGWCATAPVIRTERGPPPVGTSGWLAAIDLPSLLLTSLRPASPGEGMMRAVTALLQETANYGGAAEMRFARDPSQARTSDLTGAGVPLTVTGDAVAMDFSASEMAGIKVEWV